MHQEKGGRAASPTGGICRLALCVCVCVCIKWECGVRGQADDSLRIPLNGLGEKAHSRARWNVRVR